MKRAREAAADFAIGRSKLWAARAARWAPWIVKPFLPKAKEQTPGTVILRDLGPLGQAVSDSGTLVLEAIAAVQGQSIAADAAAGYADACARFAVRHPNAFE